MQNAICWEAENSWHLRINGHTCRSNYYQSLPDKLVTQHFCHTRPYFRGCYCKGDRTIALNQSSVRKIQRELLDAQPLDANPWWLWVRIVHNLVAIYILGRHERLFAPTHDHLEWTALFLIFPSTMWEFRYAHGAHRSFVLMGLHH